MYFIWIKFWNPTLYHILVQQNNGFYDIYAHMYKIGEVLLLPKI